MMHGQTAAETVIFFHIPKTAGTTLNTILQNNYPAEAIFATEFVDVGGIDNYQKLPEKRRAKIQLLKGHMNFGLHQYAPGGATYFTLLRDPVDRALSHYYHIRREERHPAHPYVVDNDMSIRESLEAGVDPLLFNAQTRLLSGVANSVPIGQCTREHLQLAMRNLRQYFAVVGLTEEFEKTLLLLRRVFGWQNLYYEPQNVAADRKRKSELSQATLSNLRQANSLDIELYDYARWLFDEQVNACGWGFQWDVWRFRQQNKILNPATGYYWKMRRYSVRTFLRQRFPRQQ
jgi:hypothetical protein